MTDAHRNALGRFVELAAGHRPWLVLTGAGCSTGSGIPDYRDENGEWKRKPPVHLPEFLASDGARKRYWARSMVGWRHFEAACPNHVHTTLARLESSGAIHHLVTQNVDGLHRRAGSTAVTDLHGTLDEVLCLDCGARAPREAVQARLLAANPDWRYRVERIAPDGDAELEGADYARFSLVACQHCGGTVKPDVVFFGDNVPRARVELVMSKLAESAALVVIGSSLMVYSGYRFVRAAGKLGKPVLIVNPGKTRGDDDATVKVPLPAAEALAALERRLASRHDDSSATPDLPASSAAPGFDA